MRISFKRNGFIALASMLSFAVYAGDNLPLATAASGTNGSIQVSEHGVDTSNEIQQARVIQGTVLEEGTNEPLFLYVHRLIFISGVLPLYWQNCVSILAKLCHYIGTTMEK